MNSTTFFDLPPELRNAIYAEVIDSTNGGVLTLNGSPDEEESLPQRSGKSIKDQTCCPRSLLLASKPFFTETFPIFLAAHKVRIADSAWPRIASMSKPHQSAIHHLIIDKTWTNHLTTTLKNASQLSDLRILDIQIPNFRFSRVKPFLSIGFQALKRLYISDPKVKAMAEHFAVEEDGQQLLPQLSWRIYSVEDFQTWRAYWGKVESWRALDRELEREARERMERMVVMRLC